MAFLPKGQPNRAGAGLRPDKGPDRGPDRGPSRAILTAPDGGCKPLAAGANCRQVAQLPGMVASAPFIRDRIPYAPVAKTDRGGTGAAWCDPSTTGT